MKSRRLSFAIVFSAAFCLSVTAMRLIDAGRNEGVLTGPLREKFRMFDNDKDSYTEIFVGSSAFMRDISPRAFDERFASFGASSKSFNFAVPFMTAVEMRAVVAEILKRKPRKLRAIFLNPSHDADLPFENLGNSRIKALHDFGNTLDFLSYAARSNIAWRPKLSEMAAHAAAFLFHLTRVHSLAALNQEYVTSSRDYSPCIVNSPDGFCAFEDCDDPAANERHRYLLNHAQEYFSDLQEYTAQSETELSPSQFAYLDGIADDVRRAGAAAVFITTPDTDPGWWPITKAVSAGQWHQKLFSFSDPKEYPAFFALEDRWDFGHLNKSGAIEFSRMLAAKYQSSLSK